MTDIKLFRVKKGEHIHAETQHGHGVGFLRKVAPSDGIVVETSDRIIFIPMDEAKRLIAGK